MKKLLLLLLLAAPGCGTSEKKEVHESISKTGVIEVTTQESLDKILKENSNVVVDFGATWCPPCKLMKPVNERIAKEFADKVKIVEVDIDHGRALSAAYEVQGVPTFLFFKKGESKERHVGAMSDSEYKEKLKKNFGL